MPKIQVEKNDLYRLAGLAEDYPFDALDEDLALVKGEFKRPRPGEEDILRIELNDTNRPDLWCVEGVARQLRDHRAGCGQAYSFFSSEPSADRRITVDPRLQAIRPFIGGFYASGGSIDETGLLAFIAGQEALDRNFGRQRKGVSIGLYTGAPITFPVHYRAVGWDEVRFQPLAPAGTLKDGVAQAGAPWPAGLAMTPREILAKHPTGQEYASILEGRDLVPLLVDSTDQVLSLIPIINSASLGRVFAGAEAVFVEATGLELDQVLLTLNILAANLCDRGWTILPVTAEYPYDTPRGRLVTAPCDLSITQSAPLEMFERVLGERPDPAEIVQKLTAYGIQAALVGSQVTATAPAYRQDYLHPADVIEDYAISRGYTTFAPILPEDFTLGRLQPLTEFEDLLRDLMIGFGFEEAICNILSSVEDLRQRMAVGQGPQDGAPPFHGGPLVRISNVMNINYVALRDWILPSLLEIESRSEGAVYPHRVFEVGEVGVFDAAADLGSRTESRLSLLVAEDTASFDSAQSVLYALLTTLKIPFKVLPWDHPSFIPGRSALVVTGEGTGDPAAWLGFLGELSPQVLTNWGARVPAAAMELSVERIQKAAHGI